MPLIILNTVDPEHTIPNSIQLFSIKRKQTKITYGANLKNLNLNIVLVLIVLGIGLLAYLSYQAGYKASKNNMETLLMTMTLDSNLVTAGLYEELPNSVRKTMHFYVEDTPTIVNDVKMFAEVKYVTIGGKVIKTENGKIWDILKQDRIFQRKFEKDNDLDSNVVPNSPFAENNFN